MLKKFTVAFALATGCFFISGYAQDFQAHKPAELLKVMKDSKLNYSIGELYIDVPEKDYSDLLNQPNIYHEDSGDRWVVKQITLSRDAQPEWELGEHALEMNDGKEARKHYKNVLDIQEDYYPAKIEIAKTFEKEGDLEKAEGFYKQAISKNYIDYMPHWLAALNYKKEKKYDEAVNEITIASILNRNDTAIQFDLAGIYTAAHLRYEDWDFIPQYKVFAGQKENEVKVLSQKGWQGYAVGKAIWGFEPGYAASQGVKEAVPSVIEEKECLLSLIATQNKDSDEVDPSITAAQTAQENKLLDGFIYYEVLLPENPQLVYQLPNNVIKGIKNYVVLAHGGKDIR